MTTRYLNIEAKHRQHPRLLASIKDFSVSPSDEVDAEILINNPNISLYCFDDENRRAIFIEMSDGIDLSTAPFVYFKQHEAAQRLIAVPYKTFLQIANMLPPVEHLIMIYISGRSGSTLLSHIFNALDNIVSLSEPDVISQIANLRGEKQAQDAELRELADAAVRFLFNARRDKNITGCAIKARPQALHAMDLFQETFPNVKNLYSYRDVTGYVSSFYRIQKQFDAPEYTALDETIRNFNEQFDYDLAPFTQYLDPDAENISIVQFLTLQWIICMEWYLAQVERGIPVLPIRYQDLKSSREQMLEGIFAYCDLSIEQVKDTLEVFDHDSQAGSLIARKNPKEGNQLRLTDEQLQAMNRILQRHAIIQNADYIVPNSLQV